MTVFDSSRMPILWVSKCFRQWLLTQVLLLHVSGMIQSCIAIYYGYGKVDLTYSLWIRKVRIMCAST